MTSMSAFHARLSGGDTVVSEADLILLRDGEWLNDSLISFAFEHLALQVHQHDASLLFVPPNVSFVMAHADEVRGGRSR